ncbi:hypothetical protein A0H81_03414 [Grifola frondosa]|uniref:DUF6534 domain-containing protein n=1 Tax=Grifola frondosa TaxID=5627 RepID=A0A1C7MN04_GRIFR|nr:hypothetical protein A0H81_03414 [Grifola frondosa]
MISESITTTSKSRETGMAKQSAISTSGQSWVLKRYAVPTKHVPSLNNTFGAMLIGTYIATMIYGLTTHQTYRYFRLYASDGWGLKSTVICLWVLDSFSTALSLHYCYYYLVMNYFNPEGLLEAVWSVQLVVAISSLVTIIAHLFLIRRIYLLGHNRVLTAAVTAIAIVRLGESNRVITTLSGAHLVCDPGFGFAVTIEASVSRVNVARWKLYNAPISDSQIHPGRVQKICGLYVANFHRFSLSVISDTFITIALCVSLHGTRTGYKWSDSLINILIVYTINTGLLTTMFTLATLICLVLMPKNLIYFGIFTVTTKLHPNSLLAILNSRRSIADRGAEAFEAGSFGLKTRTIRSSLPPWECIASTCRDPFKRIPAPSVIDEIVNSYKTRQNSEQT